MVPFMFTRLVLEWMSHNFLRLTSDKTKLLLFVSTKFRQIEFLLIGPDKFVSKLNLMLALLQPLAPNKVWKLILVCCLSQKGPYMVLTIYTFPFF